jgi:hypothetical protein
MFGALRKLLGIEDHSQGQYGGSHEPMRPLPHAPATKRLMEDDHQVRTAGGVMPLSDVNYPTSFEPVREYDRSMGGAPRPYVSGEQNGILHASGMDRTLDQADDYMMPPDFTYNPNPTSNIPFSSHSLQDVLKRNRRY